MDREKQFWESFRDKDSIRMAVWPDDDKASECLTMIEPFLQIKSGNRIFDLGCGHGRLLYPLACKYSDSSFVGIDISSSMIKFAATSPNIQYVMNDGMTIPFEDNYFNSGYSMIMFQHVPNIVFAYYLKEVGRVLKNGGIFRFQFVEGDDKQFLSHHAQLGEVFEWVNEAGMETVSVGEGIDPVWKWLTVIK